MKIRKPVDRPQTEEIEVCDRCGQESFQDDALRPFAIAGMDAYNVEQGGYVLTPHRVLLHGDCIPQVQAAIREAFGLMPVDNP